MSKILRFNQATKPNKMLFIRNASKVKALKNILYKVTGKTNEANISLRLSIEYNYHLVVCYVM